MNIIEFEEDRILIDEDVPCWKCGAAPVAQLYIPVTRRILKEPKVWANKLVRSGVADVYVIGGRVCILCDQTCHNPNCRRDSRKSPLEKLALQALNPPPEGKEEHEQRDPDYLDWLVRDPR